MLTQVKCVITYSPGNLKPSQSLSSPFESGAVDEIVRRHPQTQLTAYGNKVCTPIIIPPLLLDNFIFGGSYWQVQEDSDALLHALFGHMKKL